MKNRKKVFAFLLIFVMIVTCISPQQINAKTTGKKVAVTREEWICALLKQAHIKTGKVSKYHFSDTKKSSKKKVIETAYSRGILPVKKNSKKFYPKKAATREFMAVTTVRALGFQANKAVSPKCKDKKKLKYALKTADGELVVLGAYRVQPTCVAVEILYIESHPESNPTMTKQKKYIGIA